MSSETSLDALRRIGQDEAIFAEASIAVQDGLLDSDVERLAWLIYVRCGDRSEAEALADAGAIKAGLESTAPIPEWFAARLRETPR